jgi:hypothetical protein
MDVSRVPGPSLSPPVTRVRAIKMGYSDNRTRRPGDVFDIESSQVALVSAGGWMELAPYDDLLSTDATNQRCAGDGTHVKDIADRNEIPKCDTRS